MIDEKGCLTCKWASFNGSTINCKFPMPAIYPELWSKFTANVDCRFDGNCNEILETARACYCKDEYYNEGFVTDCKCWEKRKTKINLKKILGEK